MIFNAAKKTKNTRYNSIKFKIIYLANAPGTFPHLHSFFSVKKGQ